jgi:hypothetical protein
VNSSFLKILPSNNQTVKIDFKQIKLADAGDFIAIYDADTIDPNNVLAIVTNLNNGQPLSFTSSQSKMFIVFNSNSTGVDSGFIAEFYSDFNPYVLNKNISIARNLVNVPSVFVNKNHVKNSKNYNRKWYVNNTLQTAFSNKDSMKYTFNNSSAYQVCLVFSNCDTTFQVCVIDSNKTCEAYFEVLPDTTTTFSGIIQDLSTASSSSNYLWLFGDGDSSTSKTPIHTYNGLGQYDLCLTVTDGSCVSNYCKLIGFDSSGNLNALQMPFSIKIVDKNGNSTSVIELNSKSDVKIYPNPVINDLIVEGVDVKSMKIEILDVLGNVLQQDIQNNRMDFSNYNSGIYILKIMDSNGLTSVFKIIKQ